MRSSRRGYMIVEAMVASALVGVTLTVMMDRAGRAFANMAAAGRRQQAVVYLDDQVNQVRARGYANITAGTTTWPSGCTTSSVRESTPCVTVVATKNAANVAFPSAWMIDATVQYKGLDGSGVGKVVTTAVVSP